MSQPLTLEVSDEIYHILQHQANTVGLSIPDWIMSKLSHPEINKSTNRDNNQDAEENQNWENFVLNNLN